MTTEVKNPPAKSKSNGSVKDEPAGKLNEPRDQKFKRLANHRVPQAVRRIRQIANLANRNQYEFTPEQAAKIIQLLTDEVAALKVRFAADNKPVADVKLF